MAVIVFFLFIWFFCKGLKALFRLPKRIAAGKPIKAIQAPTSSVQKNLAALYALQQQRDQINDTIDYVLDCISTAETPEKTIQYMDRLSSLYGKLATVENKINKLISRE